MRWLKALGFCALTYLLMVVVVREAAPLPSLDGRSNSRAFRDTNDTPLGEALAHATRAQPGRSGVYPLPAGAEAFATRALLARAASRSIDAQYYIWHDDLTGSLLFSELLGAADRGVRVRLLLDDNNTSGVDPVIAALDAHPNIEVRLFNPFTIRSPRLLGFLTDFARLNRRMHNKSFTVDNQATVVGGRNVGDEYFDARQEGALFVDMDVLAVGAIVPRVSTDFDRYWDSGSSYPAARIVPEIEAGKVKAVRRDLGRRGNDPGAQDYFRAIRDLPLINQLLQGRLKFIWSPVRMVSDDPAKGLGRAGDEDLLFPKLREAMGQPQRSLGVVSGYFVPGDGGTEALAALAREGVGVTVLTNAFEATDVPIVHAGYAKRRKALLGAGVRIFELRGTDAAARPSRSVSGSGSSGSRLGGAGSALHAKTFAVDDQRAFIGSFNFDPRSLRLNTELGFVIESPELATRMADRLRTEAPGRAYEVRLSNEGNLYWVERSGGSEIRHNREPGTRAWQRLAITMLSLLPIEWLL